MAYITFQPSDYFNTKLFTANASTQSITGVGFQPDMVWGKSRGNSYDHEIYDAVRGVYKRIKTNQNHVELSDTGNLTSFDSDGFSLGSATNMNYTNGDNIVSWNWKANGSGSSNTDGSITGTVSANTTSGFSIVKYTGTGSNATVGHGLGATPKVVLIKDLSSNSSWRMFTEMTGNESQLALDQTSAADSSNTTMWNSTSPTTTTFSIGTHGSVNSSGYDYIAYCFVEKKGFSKFGSYAGNGNSDGPMIYTGFNPAFTLFKNASVSTSWVMHDTKRDTFNVSGKGLFPNENTAESATTGRELDIFSNGFKIRNGNGEKNTDGNTYIYMAFAEHPIVSSNDIPGTAR